MKYTYDNKHSSEGFTIIELLIVIVIIGVLVVITAVSYTGITRSAKDATLRSDLKNAYTNIPSLRMTSTGQIETGNCPNMLTSASCPANWIVVPGNPYYGTTDFCVMKYEAKNVGGVVISQAAGTPWVSINQTNAKSTAAASGIGHHLITDPEWMTIAMNVINNPIKPKTHPNAKQQPSYLGFSR